MHDVPLAHLEPVEAERAEGLEHDDRAGDDHRRPGGMHAPLAPDVLKLHGEEALMYDPNPDDSQRQRVLRAAASCPVQAILVERLDDTEEGATS